MNFYIVKGLLSSAENKNYKSFKSCNESWVQLLISIKLMKVSQESNVHSKLQWYKVKEWN